MTRRIRNLLVPALALPLVFAGAALGDKPPGRCGPGERCGKHRGPRACGDCAGLECGRSGKRAGEAWGMKGRRGGPMGRVGKLLHHLEVLNADAPPADVVFPRFGDADTDGDGSIGDAEWTAFREKARAHVLGRLARVPGADTDQDGTLSDVELDALKDKVRQRCLERNPEADTDGDGVLSDEEMTAFHAARRAERRGRILERHPEADLDGDGLLSVEEAAAFHATRAERRRARVLEHHPEADLDGDGVLSPEELREFRGDRPGWRGGKHHGRRGGLGRGPHRGCGGPSD